MDKTIIQEEALLALQGQKRAGLHITMGGGKTLIGLRHMAAIYEDGVRFLVVAPKRSIFKVWEDMAVQFNLEHLLPLIRYTTYLSLTKQSLDYKAVYLDECHSLLYTHEPWLLGYDGIIVGLTGTAPRFEKSEKGLMVDRFCPIIYRYVVQEAVDDGLLNDYRILIHHLKLGQQKNLKIVDTKTKRQWYTSEMESYLYWNKRISDSMALNGSKSQEWARLQRMRVLMGFPSKVAYAKQLLERAKNKIIVFANTQDQAELLCKNSYHAGNKKSGENLGLFVDGAITRLSAVAQLNEGVNIPDLKEGILLHSYSNERKTAQRIGRLLRLNPKEVALAHILCYDETIDETWVQSALADFDKEKVYHYYHHQNALYDYYGQWVESIRLTGGPILFCTKR